MIFKQYDHEHYRKSHFFFFDKDCCLLNGCSFLGVKSLTINEINLIGQLTIRFFIRRMLLTCEGTKWFGQKLKF